MRARLEKADETILKIGITDGYQQGIATVLYVLHMSDGYGKKRLNRLFENIQDLLNIRFGDHKTRVQSMSEELEKLYGIDVKNGIKIDVSVKQRKENG